MKENQHTTNYSDTLIEIANDYQGVIAKVPTARGEKKTVAQQQYELLINNPYQLTSDDLLFKVYAERNEIETSDLESARFSFFSKPQACLRASPLTKSHGFGIHADRSGKIALYPVESAEYQSLQLRDDVKKVRAMRASKK